MKNRRLILVRHAHRELGRGRDQDNGLSESGVEQALRIARRAMKRFGDQPDRSIRLLSSERKRCRETLAPLSKAWGLEIESYAHLLEGDPLTRKIASFLRAFHAAEEDVWIACSHGDWIPEAMFAIFHAPLSLKKGGWAEIRFSDGQARLECLMQEP